MTEYLKNNPVALRHCILYEFLRKKPVEESFNAFCETVGDGVVEKEEFQFWFNRFEQGNFDLDFERNEVKKIYKLTDMPIDVMEKIVKFLNISDRLSLTKTCRSLHQFIQDQKLFIHSLELSIHTHTPIASLVFGPSLAVYTQSDDDCRKEFKESTTLIQGVPYWKQAILDLKNNLRNPKLHLEILSVHLDIDDRNIDYEAFEIEIINELKTAFTHQLHVKKLISHASSFNPFLKILPYFKPGYLNTIEVSMEEPRDVMIKKPIEIEQWKQAEYFSGRNLCFFRSLRNFYHFKQFDVDCDEISVEDVRQVKEVLFKSPDFERCSISVSYLSDESVIKREFGVPFLENTCHYPIPNSTEFFEIKIVEWKIEISRKKT